MSHSIIYDWGIVIFDSQGKIRAMKPPGEADFQTIKLISNGAYGWVKLQDILLTPLEENVHVQIIHFYISKPGMASKDSCKPYWDHICIYKQ